MLRRLINSLSLMQILELLENIYKNLIRDKRINKIISMTHFFILLGNYIVTLETYQFQL
jgi:hypothetical protein